MSILSTVLRNPAYFLLSGIVIILLLSRSSKRESIRKSAATISKQFLQWAIIFMGASLNFSQVASLGLQTFIPTLAQIVFVLLCGLALSKFLKLPGRQTFLISVGTAICGGSAIAAIGPVILASSTEMAVALTVTFLLNAVGLFLFPILGQFAQLSHHDFGIWAALAIHDTSSVVGAAAQYGSESVPVATIYKLTRALWILPLTAAAAFYVQRQNRKSGVKAKKPWFILGFILASMLFSFIPTLTPYAPVCSLIGRSLLCLALLSIGLCLDLGAFKRLGPKALVYAVTLWALTASSSFFWWL